MSMEFLDVNVMLGARSVPEPWESGTLADLLHWMDHYGIAEALVYHTIAREGHPPRGNARLMQDIAGQPRLHPCWVLLPPGTCEMPPAEELIPAMIQQGVRAGRVFTHTIAHRVRLDPEWFWPLAAVMAQACMPLIIDPAPLGAASTEVDWPNIHRLCIQFPALPVILVNLGYRFNRDMYPLLAQHANLYFDLAFYANQWAIEDIARRFGAHHVLYGSHYPMLTPGGPLCMIGYSILPEADRRAMAGGTLRRLLESVVMP